VHGWGGGATRAGGVSMGGKLIIYNRGTGGDQRVKESEWKMRRTRGGVDGVKNRNGQWEGPGGGELNGCIMHQVHTIIK
jgi:hypothetical protein